MNDTQNVFIVFYAIFWGMVANVQPRWKAFQLPLVFRFRPATHRVVLSFIALNVLPICYFGWTIWMLSGDHLQVKEWGPSSVVLLLVHAVLPAFATFGFYRLWLGIVELNPLYFYAPNSAGIPEDFRHAEPTVMCLKLKSTTACCNILYALSYVLVGLISAQVFR